MKVQSNIIMNKTLIITSIALVALIIGMGINSEGAQSYLRTEFSQPVTVPFVDIDKYAGSWYEQAVIPFYFERGCSKTVATYSKNADGKSIKVENNCTRNGKVVTSIGKAIPEDSTNAKLKVEFVQTLDIGGQYWVVRLGKNYEYSVVSSPNYNYLWILSRERHMAEDLYQSIYNDLKKDNFPVEKLKRTEQ